MGGLLPDYRQNRALHSALAQVLMRYGELSQVPNDNSQTSVDYMGPDFEFDKDIKAADFTTKKEGPAELLAYLINKHRFLRARWSAKSAMKHALETSITGADKYEAIEGPDFANIYAYAGRGNLAADQPARNVPFTPDQMAVIQVDEAMVAESGDPNNSQRAFWQGYVAVKKNPDTREDEEIVFVFRGTLRFDEWVSNLAGGSLVPYTDDKGEPLIDASVHWGFRNMYNAKLVQLEGGPEVDNTVCSKMTPRELVEKVLYERYFKNNRPLPRITTTGHSLGAALATLCAFHIAWELPHTKRVAGHDIPEDSIFWAQLRSPGAVVAYPLASPRLCDERFAEVVNSTPGLKVLRTTNLCDFVPRVPLPDKDDPNLLEQLLQQILDWLSTPTSAQAPGAQARDVPSFNDLSVDLQRKIMDRTEAAGASTVDKLGWGCLFVSLFGGPVVGEGAPNRAESAVNLGFLHVGRNLEFNTATGPTKPCQLRIDYPDLLKVLFVPHSLELYLIAVGILAEKPIKRDFALLNKDGDLLRAKLAEKYGIEPGWWADYPDFKGLEQQGKKYRQPGGPRDDPHDADPCGPGP